ncbi:MAG TPA: cell division protein FtsA, partial [Acidobacteriota bacterium]|nr:cell division protein FtsA [Acidobacteriota bacterium]
MPKPNHPLVGLDIGNTRVRVLIAAWNPDKDRLDVLGASSVASKGVRKGVIVNIESAEECIRQALTEAEHMAGVDAHQVHVGLSGAHVRGHNGR